MNRRALLIAVWAAGLAAYFVFLLSHTCFAVGGSDSSGYANSAKFLLLGEFVAPVPTANPVTPSAQELAAFVPVGFVQVPGSSNMAPLYPVGFPIHLAAAAAVLGWEIGPYLVSPAAALGTLILTALVGRRLGLSPWGATGAAVVLGASPVFVAQALQPMSDVAATFWSLAALYCGLRGRSETRWNLAAGLAFGMSVLIRPMSVLLGIPLLLASRLDVRSIRNLLLGGSPMLLLLLSYNTATYGHPLTTGYGLAGLWDAFAWANIPDRLRAYSSWTLQLMNPLVCVGWIAALIDRRILLRDRLMIGWWFAMFLFAYSSYGPADAWWYTRFLLPAYPALALGFALALRGLVDALARRLPGWGSAFRVASILVVAMIVGTGTSSLPARGVYGIERQELIYPVASRWAARALPADALVLSVQMSGALRYYTDLTPVRWDVLDPPSFDRLRSATQRPWYALIYKFEVARAAEHVPGPWVFLGESGPVTLWRYGP